MTAARIVVGIAGGIAAFKVASTVSKLVQAGHSVDVVLTENAHQFIGPATFAALCGRAPVAEIFDARYPLGAHIELAEQADLLLIAPATARILASCAWGLVGRFVKHAVFDVRVPSFDGSSHEQFDVEPARSCP